MAYRSALFTQRPIRRTVVTGAGLITAHGNGWRVNADALRDGVTSLRPVTLFDVSRQRVGIAGEVILPDELPPNQLTPRELSRIERGSRLLLHAAYEALTQAGLSATEMRSLPCVLGTSAGGMTLGEDFFRHTAGPVSGRRGQATRASHYQAVSQAGLLGRGMRVGGPATLIANACASGANAIAHGFSLVRHGATDAVLCGGYDALSQLVFAGFDSLKALSTTVARPFDAHRDGLALGEGAGLLVLETLENARARGATILAEIAGSGASTDLHHLTQPHPEGDAALASMTEACRMAGLEPQDIDYLNAHGTGTPLNDSSEARAIQRWAGTSGTQCAVSSTKGGMGHLLGGAGAVEAVVCLMVLREGFFPPCVSVQTPDPVCTFDLVCAPRGAIPRAVLTNSFGFGGSNATLLFRQPPD